ncbi:MAG: sterol desaturase family protein [Halieaceae bacterium]|jgi:sterol desaturase/sphingolipid hydroxylase (fatty acid hydroxylase superfamily)|nr:sterol desaturase family protein [Halieaceae bacterium]
MDLITIAVPFFLLSILLEFVWGWWRGNNTYRLNDMFSSLMLGNLSQARRFVTLGVGGLVYHWITDYFSLPLWDASAWWTWVVAFVLYDFCYYWLHRMGHERQILWAAHVAHHQSEDYNLSTALRQTSTGFLLGWLFYIPMFLLGIPAEVVVTVGALNLIYQFWVHTQHVPELGWLEFIFVTPSNHRVHHAQNDRYLDRNYGGVFIVWDRLFGTYQRELPEEPCVYGIRGPINSWNPVVALTHIYRDMCLDMVRAGSLKERLAVLFARTGWQPDSIPAEHRRAKNDLSQFRKFDPAVSGLMQWSAGLQLIIATLLLVFGQLLASEAMPLWAVWGLMIWLGVSTAWWLEGRGSQWLFMADLLRGGVAVWLLYSDGAAYVAMAVMVISAVSAGLTLADTQKNTRIASGDTGMA